MDWILNLIWDAVEVKKLMHLLPMLLGIVKKLNVKTVVRKVKLEGSMFQVKVENLKLNLKLNHSPVSWSVPDDQLKVKS